MNKNDSGMIVLMLPLLIMIFLATVFLVDWGRVLYISRKAQSVVEAAVVSSQRIKAGSLETVAVRWNEFGRDLTSADGNQINVRSADWTALSAQAKKLQQALSGYKGRVKAVVSVVTEANGIPGSALQWVNAGGLELEVAANDRVTIDENGVKRTLTGAWYKRLWSPGASAPAETSPAEAALELSVPCLLRFPGAGDLSSWEIKAKAGGVVRWDVSSADAEVLSKGNGGYPRTWPEALSGTHVEPFRYPFFRGELAGE